MNWFKFYGQDFITDTKLSGLNPFQRLMWVTLLCIASQDETKSGVLKYLDESRLVALSGLNYDDMESMYGTRKGETLETFCNMGLVTCNNDNTLTVTNFNKKQTQQRTSTERVAAWRERNKAKNKEDNNVTNVTNVTLQSNGRIDKNRIDNNNIIYKEKEIIKKKKETPIEDISESDIQGIAEMYSVPQSFVLSKLDDLKNWHEKNPQKNHYKNYKAALRDWVKRDAINIKKEAYGQSKLTYIPTEEESSTGVQAETDQRGGHFTNDQDEGEYTRSLGAGG